MHRANIWRGPIQQGGTIEGSRTPAANTAGWNNTDVTVSFTCDDTLSGVPSGACPVDVTVSSEGANQSVERSVTDAAGNTAIDTVGDINIDKTPPVVTLGAVSGTQGTGGWYTSAVSQTFNASDALSGLPASFTTPFSVASSGEGSAVEIKSGAVTDNAGNTNNGISATFKIDLSDPYNIQFVGGPADGASYDFGNVPGAPTCSAQDDVSGMPTSGGCVVTGYSAAVTPTGTTHTLTATATDNAGRTATATRTYTVKAWALGGFFQPVDMDTGTTKVWNTVKNGSTVPLKFEVFNSAGELTDIAVVDKFTVTPVVCSNGNFVSDAIEFTTTGSTTLRYDGTAGQFIQNWQTPKKAGACYDVTMQTDDGSKLVAHFQLK